MNATCAECLYYSVDAQQLNQGGCLVNPPTIVTSPSPRGLVMQSFNPNVPGKRPACRFFKSKAFPS